MIKLYLFILISLMLCVSCKKKDIDTAPVADNKAPVTMAGDETYQKMDLCERFMEGMFETSLHNDENCTLKTKASKVNPGYSR